MHQLINDDIEHLESNIYKLCTKLREYIYLNDSYDTDVIHTIADKLKSNINKLLETTDQTDQNNKV